MATTATRTIDDVRRDIDLLLAHYRPFSAEIERNIAACQNEMNRAETKEEFFTWASERNQWIALRKRLPAGVR